MSANNYSMIDDGVFKDQSRKCSCCEIDLNIYFYPMDYKTSTRNLRTCISCKRDCANGQCQLGVLHED